MNPVMAIDLEAWEDDGGAMLPPLGVCAISMTGAANQVEWGERNQALSERRVRSRGALTPAGCRSKQSDLARSDTDAIVAILKENRVAVMSGEQAGDFISRLARDRRIGAADDI